MDQQLTSLIALDADEASKLSILDDMLLEPRETPKSEEIRSLFWISLLSLSVRALPVGSYSFLL